MAVAQEKGFYTPATDSIKVECPSINPTPLTFFDANLDPNDVKIDVSSGLSQFFSHQSMAKLVLTTPKGASRIVSVPFKVTVTRPVWVVGNTPITANEMLAIGTVSGASVKNANGVAQNAH